MGWPKKKPDPVSERARALNAEIAALEQQIKKLDSQIGKVPQPRLRSTALPHGATVQHSPEAGKLETQNPKPETAPAEPIFEDVDQNRLKAKTEIVAPPEHFNELGVRKYDLAGQIARLKNNFRGPAASNPRLVNYLAAGGVQGLRPMRYEKRVARRRLVWLTIGLLLLLIGTLSVFIRSR